MARSLAGAPGTANLYGGANTVEEAGKIYAPPGSVNDRQGTNHKWGLHVGSIYDNYVNSLRSR